MKSPEDIAVSKDIVESFFVCDLESCKGACCVEGDLGASLEEDELAVLEDIYEAVAPFLSAEGLRAIEAQGLYVLDAEGDFSTPTIGGRECAYAVYDEAGILKCGIEQAFRAGKTDFIKPISCHLYPIRVSRREDVEVLRYDKWRICDPACALGEQLAVPLYRFLKEPLIRRYGREWYDQLVAAVEG